MEYYNRYTRIILQETCHEIRENICRKYYYYYDYNDYYTTFKTIGKLEVIYFNIKMILTVNFNLVPSNNILRRFFPNTSKVLLSNIVLDVSICDKWNNHLVGKNNLNKSYLDNIESSNNEWMNDDSML